MRRAVYAARLRKDRLINGQYTFYNHKRNAAHIE